MAATTARASQLPLILARRACRTGSGRQLRLRAGVTLREAAEDIGVDPGTLSRWERGLEMPKGTRARLYGAHLERLLAADGTATAILVSNGA
jgi:DNA-binding XRE family transcriptional regulator